MEIDEALRIIRKVAGSKFDLTVVEALEAVVQSGKLRLAPSVVEVNAPVNA
jgi:HD-GYP domain-containing protein (c-di-GMP phosphodiesterase class II)